MLTMRQKKAITKELKDRYQRSSKKEKTIILNEFIQSLNFTDICTSWVEMIAVKNKAQVWVFTGIKNIKERSPFSILWIDSDNGSEFINDHLLRYCDKHKITFTRSRPYRKNESCFVEQKNYSIIRRAVGYSRYDTAYELTILNELYSYLNSM